MIELLGPQHAGECLTHDIPGVRGQIVRDDGCVELVGFRLRVVEDAVECRRTAARSAGLNRSDAGERRRSRQAPTSS